MRSELAQTGADAFGIGREVKGAEGADFAVADEAGVGLDADDGAIKHGDGLAAAPLVGRLVQGELDAIGLDAGDLHGAGTFQTFCSTWNISGSCCLSSSLLNGK